jgi:hypothetical protein
MWMGHLERMEEIRSLYKVLIGKMTDWDYVEDLAVVMNVILKCILEI